MNEGIITIETCVPHGYASPALKRRAKISTSQIIF